MFDAIHAEVARMSDAAMREYPEADYVITVTLPSDPNGKPSVRVHASATLTIPAQTNLSNVEEIPERGFGEVKKLMPKPGEILKIIYPDASVTYCTNRPKWVWLRLLFTEL